MILTDIFDDIADPILILNQEGDVTYHNGAGRKMIRGETIDSLGIGPLQTVFSKLEFGELKLPFSFDYTADSHVRYHVKVQHLYEAVVVHFRQLNSSDETAKLKKNLILLLHDLLAVPLEQLETSLQSLLDNLLAKESILPQEKDNFETVIWQGKQVLRRSNKIQVLGELYLDDLKLDYELVAPEDLFDMALEHVRSLAKHKNIAIKPFLQTRDSFYCHLEWLQLALAECLSHVIEQSQPNQILLLKQTSNSYFHTIDISSVAAEDLVETEEEMLVVDGQRERRFYQNLQQTVELDLLLAERIIGLHGGQLQINKSNENDRLLIEIPISGEQSTHNLTQQAKLFARDLAKLEADNRQYIDSKDDAGILIKPALSLFTRRR